jgi:hypothetical protein
VIAHEIAETVTNPDGNDESTSTRAWTRNSLGVSGEVGDLCERSGRGFVPLTYRSFDLQSLWVNAGGGGCVFSFGTPPPPNPTPTSPLYRYVANGVHYALNGLTTPPFGSVNEGQLGILTLPSQPGMHLIYSCGVPNFRGQLVSVDVNCEGVSTFGVEGYAFDGPGAGRVPIYRCLVITTGGAGVPTVSDRFLSGDPGCEGHTTDQLLGYLATPPPPPPPPCHSQICAHYFRLKPQQWLDGLRCRIRDLRASAVGDARRASCRAG